MWIDPSTDEFLRLDADPPASGSATHPPLRGPAMSRQRVQSEPAPGRADPAEEAIDGGTAPSIAGHWGDVQQTFSQPLVVVQDHWDDTLLAGGQASSCPAAPPAAADEPTPITAPGSGWSNPQPPEESDVGQSGEGVKAFTAVWEVDALEYSGVIARLFGDPTLVRSISHPLDRAVSEGLQSLLVTSQGRGAGRTSVATGIAVAAAAAGLRAILVDATFVRDDPHRCTLADTLNLDVQHGWLEAIRGGISVAETAIHSIEDQMTVLPLVQAPNLAPATAAEFGRMLAALRHRFDLIVIDGSPCSEASLLPMLSPSPATGSEPSEVLPLVDAAILVQDCRQGGVAETVKVMHALRRLGITGLGLVENFAP